MNEIQNLLKRPLTYEDVKILRKIGLEGLIQASEQLTPINWPESQMTYHTNKRKLILWHKGIVVWRYYFKGNVQSNIERILKYITEHPKQKIDMYELAQKAELVATNSRIQKTHQNNPNQTKIFTNMDYFCSYRLDDEIKKVFRRGKLAIEIGRLFFDLHHNWVIFQSTVPAQMVENYFRKDNNDDQIG